MRVTLSPFSRILPTLHGPIGRSTEVGSRLHLDVHLGGVIQDNVHVLVKTLNINTEWCHATVICPSMRVFDWSYSQI